MRRAFGPTNEMVLGPTKYQKTAAPRAGGARSKQALCHPGTVPIHMDFRRDPRDRGVMLNELAN